MTTDEIKERVRERLEESSSSPLRYPDADLDQYIVDGARYYIARTGCYTGTQTITQVADTLFYDLDLDVIQVERVLWSSGGVYYPLEPTTPRELDNEWTLDGKWIREEGTHAERYFLLGLSKIALHPIITSSTETYIVHYQKDLGSYDTPTDIVPIEDHEFLVNYCLSRCLLAETKVAEGMAEYAEYKRGVMAATRRMANVDRVWAMSHGTGIN